MKQTGIHLLSHCFLCDQLENTVGGPQAYQQRVTQHLIPCVGQFAVALADDTQWKTLNYQILLKSRHSDSKVMKCPEFHLSGGTRVSHSPVEHSADPG